MQDPTAQGTREGSYGSNFDRFLPSCPHTIPSLTHIILWVEGYWCRRAVKSWVLGMKTLWVSRKSLRNVSVGQG